MRIKFDWRSLVAGLLAAAAPALGQQPATPRTVVAVVRLDAQTVVPIEQITRLTDAIDLLLRRDSSIVVVDRRTPPSGAPVSIRSFQPVRLMVTGTLTSADRRGLHLRVLDTETGEIIARDCGG